MWTLITDDEKSAYIDLKFYFNEMNLDKMLLRNNDTVAYLIQED